MMVLTNTNIKCLVVSLFCGLVRCRALKDSQRKYWAIKMGFLYKLVSKPISVLLTQASKNGRLFLKSEFEGMDESSLVWSDTYLLQFYNQRWQKCC